MEIMNFICSSMFNCDPVSFYSLLLEYRKAEYALKNNWVLLKPAELLFSRVSSLIFTGDRGIWFFIIHKNCFIYSIAEFNPELCPKWLSLIQILKVEIPQNILKSNYTNNKILILCSDRKTCYQLNEVMTIISQCVAWSFSEINQF